LFAYGPPDACAVSKTCCLLAHLNPDWFYPFWYQLTPVVLEKRPLNGCSSSSCLGLPGEPVPEEFILTCDRHLIMLASITSGSDFSRKSLDIWPCLVVLHASVL